MLSLDVESDSDSMIGLSLRFRVNVFWMYQLLCCEEEG